MIAGRKVRKGNKIAGVISGEATGCGVGKVSARSFSLPGAKGEVEKVREKV